MRTIYVVCWENKCRLENWDIWRIHWSYEKALQSLAECERHFNDPNVNVVIYSETLED